MKIAAPIVVSQVVSHLSENRKEKSSLLVVWQKTKDPFQKAQ
jgi:hypothetical protein